MTVRFIPLLAATLLAGLASQLAITSADGREAWTTSNVRGRPEPPPRYRAERVFPRISLRHTTLIAHEPTLGRFFVGERGGRIHAFPEDRLASDTSVFFDCQAAVDRLNRGRDTSALLDFDSLYGMAFDPDFATNRFCYVCYVVRHRDRTLGHVADGTRVVRLRVKPGEPPECDPESEQLVIAWLEGGHNGGCLRFGPDGCLYISSGDGSVVFPPDQHRAGQDLTTLLSKILRIDVRGGTAEQPYRIPADNPFVELAGARGETWAYGLRNPWKMSFDRQQGDLWVGDVGWELLELVGHVRRGDNFGWSIVEGSQPVHADWTRGPTPIVPHAMEIPHTEAASITGGFVYRGPGLPELVGSYIFGDWETRRIWAAKVDGGKLGERTELIDPTVRIVDFAEDEKGELYLLDHEDGAISMLVRNADAHHENRFPQTLAATGLFAATASHTLAAGVVPFVINVEQWSDHAVAERAIGVPDGDAVRIRAEPKLVPGSQFSRTVEFPKDTVLLKTLSLDTVAGDPRSRRRIETQMLHYDGREWLGYTYEWNADETDAVLVDRAGKEREIQVVDPGVPGGRRSHKWRFSGRAECLRCHNPWSEHTLAFTLPQLNRPHPDGAKDGNQLTLLRDGGLIVNDASPDPDKPFASLEVPHDSADLPRLAPAFDPAFPLHDRGRSYLHVNCAHCHRFNGGGSASIYLSHDLRLRDTMAVDVAPTQGTFGISDAKVIAPGDPYRSVLYYRLAKPGPGHMPHLGAADVDERGLRLIHDWIASIPAAFADETLVERLVELDEATVVDRERQGRPQAEWQVARKLADRERREDVTEADRAAARMEVDRFYAANAQKRDADRRRRTTELLASPVGALALVEAMRRDQLPPGIRQVALDIATTGDVDPAVRDLFEPFLPESQRMQRLGDSIDADALLAVAGVPDRGRVLFHESTVLQCRNCHRVGAQGGELGPPLDAIGRKLDRRKLLESVLYPSREIDRAYANWVVQTTAGTVLSGLLVEQTDAGILLRDSRSELHRIPREEIEEIVPQQKSLMPEALFRDLTIEQAADLLAYLGTLRGAPTQ
jgi:putative heme-binding domain-containing protein